MALHKHGGSHAKPHISNKASLGLAKFKEEQHKRDALGKFADKPGAGNDAPKKVRPGKTEPAGGGGGSRAGLTASKLDGSYQLSIIAKGNPKKGTAAARYNLYKPGMTIDDYVAAVEKSGLGDKKQALRDIIWDMKQGWIKSSKPGAKAPAAAAGAAVGGGALAAGAAVQAEAAVAKAVVPQVMEAKPAIQLAAEKKLAAPEDVSVETALSDLKKATNYESMEFSTNESIAANLDSGMYATPAAQAALNKHGLQINKTDVQNGEFSDAVAEYTNTGYSDLNYNLRNNKALSGDEKILADQLDKAVATSSLHEDTVLHRFVDSAKFKSTLDNTPVGSTVISPAFTSTTLHPGGHMNISEMSEDGAASPINMRILGRKGEKALYLEPGSMNQGEFEVLLPRGAQLRYLGKDDKGFYQFEYASAVKKADLPEINKLAGPEAVPVSSVAVPISAKGFTKTGDQMGSNEGGTYTSPGGDKFYIKTAQSVQHAENELLANALYEKLGVNTLKPEAFDLDGKLATGSKIAKLDKFDPNNPLHIADAHAAYAQHAFVANWDAVGLSYDNLGYVDGKLTMLDAGGALKYRAKGAPKPNFGPDVAELDTLKSPVNPQSQKVFGSISSEAIAKSAAPIVALSDSEIDNIVGSVVKDAGRAAQFSSILKGRRDDLKARVESLTKTAAAEKQVAANLADQLQTSKPTPAAVAATASPPVAPAAPTPPASGTKSQVPLAKGTPVAASTNPDPLPLGSTISPSTKLHMEVVGNPKISSAAARFALYKDGMTVQDYVDAVGDKKQALKDIAWDMKQGWISASKPAPTPAVSAQAEALADKLKAAASSPNPPLPTGPAAVQAAVASSGVSLAKPGDVKALVSGAEKAGTIAPGTAVVVPKPSPPQKYDDFNAGQGTTAMDSASKQGLPPTDTNVYVKALAPGPSLHQELLQNVSEGTGPGSGLSAQSQTAGLYISLAAADHGPSSVTVFAQSKGKYVGAIGGQVSGEVVTITAAGSIKSGSGVSMIGEFVEQAAQKGATKIQVTTTSPDFYTTHGFKPTAVKDTYELDISAKTVKATAAKVAVGDVPPASKSPTATLLASTPQTKVTVTDLPSGAKTSQVGSVTIITDASGHKYDASGGGGVTALDPKTLSGQSAGANAQTSVFGPAAHAGHVTTLNAKVMGFLNTGASENSSEFTAAKKSLEILAESNGSPSNKVFGFSVGASGQLKGAISGKTAPGTDAVEITSHSSLSSGGGTAALNQLIASAQAAGKKEILVKSGMVEYYKSQGFTASVDHNGYLSLKIDPVKYTKPAQVFQSIPTTGLSQPSEVLMKQIQKGGVNKDTSQVDPSKYKTIDYTSSDYIEYKNNNLDTPLSTTEKAQTKYYTGGGSSQVNPYLYNDKPLTPDLQNMVDEMDKAIAKTSFKEDHQLWRAVNTQMKSLFAHLEPGDIFAPANYTSTSVKKGVFGSGETAAGYKFKETMKIYANKGAKGIAVAGFSNYASEEETILPRNAPLRFLGISPEGFYEFEYK